MLIPKRRPTGSVLCGLMLSAALPLIAHGARATILVAPPNGTDDTVDIQGALEQCVAQGTGCTVQLGAGTYHTRQLVTYNFQGAFRGMGEKLTIIEALPNLFVNFKQDNYESICQPNTTTCFWPSLILFVDPDIHVSDFSVYENSPPATATTTYSLAGTPFNDLYDVLSFIGQHANVTVDRVHVEGLPDPTNALGAGFNVLNLLHFTGEFPRSLKDWDWYFLSGSLTVRNSSFKSATVGVSQDGFVTSSHVTIGGAPGCGNHFENDFSGIDIEASENSVFDISYNQSSGMFAGMWVVPWQPVFVPSSPSHYYVHDNVFVGTAQFGDGMYFQENPGEDWIRGSAWNNTIVLQNTLMEGIGAYNTTGTAIWDNSVTGSGGNDGIGLWNTSRSSVVGNNVSDFSVDPSGLAQVFLDPSSTQDLVVCLDRSDQVLNQGSKNLIVACGPPTVASAATPR